MAGLVTEELNKFGPFGKYNGVTIVTNTSLDFSSGSLCASSFILSGSTQNVYVDLARGGRLQLTALNEGTLYEIGIASATSVAATENILVIRR